MNFIGIVSLRGRDNKNLVEDFNELSCYFFTRNFTFHFLAFFEIFNYLILFFYFSTLSPFKSDS